MSYDLAALINPSMEDHLESLVVACERLHTYYGQDALKSAARRMLVLATNLFSDLGETCLVDAIMYMEQHTHFSETTSLEAGNQSKEEQCCNALLPFVLLKGLKRYAAAGSKLSQVAQLYVVNHNQTWPALFPMVFDNATLDMPYPGLLAQAHLVHDLVDGFQQRLDSMQEWLMAKKSKTHSLVLPDKLLDD